VTGVSPREPGAGRGVEQYRQAPPVGEEIHLPNPSVLPLLTAIAITLIVIGTTITWILSAIGGVLFVVCVFRWLRDTRRDISELPEEH
jgi:multisubunit Na+/H+ antiporter MnhC subunit